MGSLKQEYGVGEDNVVHLDNIQLNLRTIDQILMGELLGLTEQEQLEIYQTVFDLAEGRLLKAKSGEVTTRGTLKEGIDIETFVSMVSTDIEVIEAVNTINTLYRNLVVDKNPVLVTVLPPEAGIFRGKPKLVPTLWGYDLHLGKSRTSFSKDEYGRALYHQAWATIRIKSVLLPLEIDSLVNETNDLLSVIEDLVDTVKNYTSKVVDIKLRRVIETRIWNELKEQVLNTSVKIRDS